MRLKAKELKRIIGYRNCYVCVTIVDQSGQARVESGMMTAVSDSEIILVGVINGKISNFPFFGQQIITCIYVKDENSGIIYQNDIKISACDRFAIGGEGVDN
ncbi:MAG: hypothetical protein ABH884_00060 [Candidatus Komeilibacteria bacterium]